MAGTLLSLSSYLLTLVFLTQVANAAKLNASAVLIYPDPADYQYLFEDTMELFGHVSEQMSELSVLLVAWSSNVKLNFRTI